MLLGLTLTKTSLTNTKFIMCDMCQPILTQRFQCMFNEEDGTSFKNKDKKKNLNKIQRF